MEAQELTGYYTYRSFLDLPLPVDDFNKLRFAEAELFLIVQSDGMVGGTLSFPADVGASEKLFMDITGNVKSWSSSITLEFKGKGRPNTEIFDYLYEYSCSVTKSWEKGIGQCLSLTGTVLRAQDHGSGTQISKAGATASFIAVKRQIWNADKTFFIDFTEPRDISGMVIIPSALSMLASKSHRLKHTVWHTARGQWNDLREESKKKIRDLGWGIDRPPFTKDRALDLSNGAGEDFLYMHRKMISMVRHEYDIHKIPYIESWKTLPQPNTQQFAYSEQDDPTNPDKKIYRFNALDSGYMIPPATPLLLSQQPDNFSELLKFFKSPAFFNSVMSQLERQFKEPSYLSALSLGALGNLLEFTIHNQMHMRWSSVSRDPSTNAPAIRSDFDFDLKWDDPKYDYLGEFYSSHVNPIFWRLHGWVDDRIEDWFNAHEAARPGEIERYDHQGIAWFKSGKWVQVNKPFYWPEVRGESHNDEHHHNGSDQNEIDIMLKVMEIIRVDITKRQSLISGIRDPRPILHVTSFMRFIPSNR
jgi:hypothetical protein